MSKALLTIVIPVYNTAEYLGRCIESVTNQTEQNIEIIIINDGSTDNSDEIIQKYLRSNPQIQYIKLEENIGVGNARNIGIDNAKTKYITFIDSDDWVDTTYYENMLKIIERDNTDICIAGIKTEVDDVYLWKYRYKYPADFIVSSDFCLHSLTNQYNHNITISPIVNNKIYNRTLILNNQIMFDKSRRAQDVFFSFMIFIYANKVSICHNEFYHYYQRNYSATHNFTKQYVDDYFNILVSLKTELKFRGLYSLYKNEFESYVNHCMTKLINNMFNNIQMVNEQKNYVTYILNKTVNLISIERLMEYIDIERIKRFWQI